MLITSTLNPQRQASSSQPKAVTRDDSTFHNEPIDGWNPGESKAMAALAPYSFAALAAGAGLVAGFGEGPAAIIGGAVALGAAGAGGTLVLTDFIDRDQPDYKKNALVGLGVGTGLGLIAGSIGGPAVGVASAVLGAGGAYVAGRWFS